MEKKSLINLIEDEIDEEEDDKEEENPEVDRLKKRYHLAFSILNFVSNRHAKESVDSEDQILDQLFDITDHDQIDIINSQIQTEDPVVLASSVVENRINQLDSITKEPGTDPELIIENQDKIKALEDIQYYLMSEKLEPEIISVSTINAKSEFTPPIYRHPVQPKVAETVPKVEAVKPPGRSKAKKPRSINLKTEKFNKHLLSEQRIETNAVPSKITELVLEKPTGPQPVRVEPLVQAREILKRLYTGRAETPITKTETVIVEHQEPISKSRYLDISKKITVDNISLRQFFNRNHFNERARKRIISEILSGERPDKVLGKEMKRRGKFKQLIGSYANNEAAAITLPTTQTQAHTPASVSKQLTKKDYSQISFYSSRVWSIIAIGLIILLLILFMIFR